MPAKSECTAGDKRHSGFLDKVFAQFHIISDAIEPLDQLLYIGEEMPSSRSISCCTLGKR